MQTYLETQEDLSVLLATPAPDHDQNVRALKMRHYFSARLQRALSS
jgi:hypothetical protein